MIHCRVLNKAITAALDVSHCATRVLKGKLDVENVLDFEEKGNHCVPCDRAGFAALANTVYPLDYVAGIRGGGDAKPSFEIVNYLEECFFLKAYGALRDPHPIEYS